MNDFISKPVKPDALLQIVERWALASCAEEPHASPICGEDVNPLSTISQLFPKLTEDALLELLREFVNEAAEPLRAMKLAIARENATALGVAAQALQGMGHRIGSEGLVSICDHIKKVAEEGKTLSIAQTLIDDAGDEYRRCARFLGDRLMLRS